MTPPRLFELIDGAIRGALEGQPEYPSSRCREDEWTLALYGDAAAPGLAVTLERGGGPYPFLWAGIYPLVSHDLAALFTLSGLTGWTTFPVDVRRQDGTSVGGYKALGVTGRCDRIAYGDGYSEIVERTFPGGVFLNYKGLYVDIESWDGSDFIMGRDREYRTVVVTARVSEVLMAHRVKNCDLVPVEDFEFPVLPHKPT